MKRAARFLVTLSTATMLATSAVRVAEARPSSPQQGQEKALPPITLDLRDAPIRQALESLFGEAKVDFSVDNSVAGYVTLKITEQPFENALKLILRSASVPLTYSKESGVYIVKPRPIVDPNTALAATTPPLVDVQQKPNYQPLEQIQVTFIDPADLAGVLGIQFIQTSVRGNKLGGGSMGGMGGGMMGGMGGMGGGMMGGMGGMGGGMMGGMGGMMGGMGGMGGGMMGGMGGGFMGGGRGF